MKACEQPVSVVKNFNKVEPSWKNATHNLGHHAVATANNTDTLTTTTTTTTDAITTNDNGMVQEQEGFGISSTHNSSIKLDISCDHTSTDEVCSDIHVLQIFSLNCV